MTDEAKARLRPLLDKQLAEVTVRELLLAALTLDDLEDEDVLALLEEA